MEFIPGSGTDPAQGARGAFQPLGLVQVCFGGPGPVASLGPPLGERGGNAPVQPGWGCSFPVPGA